MCMHSKNTSTTLSIVHIATKPAFVPMKTSLMAVIFLPCAISQAHALQHRPLNNFMYLYAYHMIKVGIIKVDAGQILPFGQVTGNKEFTIGGLNKFYSCYMATVVIIVNGHGLGIGTHRGH